MRILVIAETWPPSVGGGEQHAALLADALIRNHNCRIVVLTRSFSDDGGSGWGIVREKNGRLTVLRIPPPMRIRNLFARCWFIFVGGIIGIFLEADIIHAHAFSPAIPAKIIQFIRRKPVVFTVHGTRLHTKDNLGHGILDRFFFWLERKLLLETRYDYEISVDHRFLTLPNVNRHRAVIPTGFDARGFSSIQKKRPKRLTFLFVGRIQVQKGLPYLIDAFVRLHRENPKLLLRIVGDGPLRAHLEKEIRARGLSQHIVFCGQASHRQVIMYYKTADIFVLPSLYEGHPITMLEAWEAQLPVIVTDVGDNHRYVTHGKNGYLVPPKNSHALARAMKKMVNNPDRDKMGLAGYRMVHGRFTWDECAEKVFGIFQRIVYA